VAPAAGDGLTTATAFQITELGNLVWLGERAAANETSGKYYQLMNDIDASATATWNDAGTTTDTLEGFRPIGNLKSSTTSFLGVFNVNGKRIIGLTINRPGEDGVGLFGCIGPEGQVRNLILEGGGETGNNSVGSVAGRMNGGRVERCFATGVVTGVKYTGGLVGYNSRGTIENCFMTGGVTGSLYVGGLAGVNPGGEIRNSFAIGRVTGDGFVGGLLGSSGTESSTVTACYWDRETSGQTVSAGSAASFGKTTAEMKQLVTFQPGGGAEAADWDFASVWGIVEGQSYPYLWFSPPPFRLNILVAGSGSVTLDPPGDVYAPGTTVALTAIPSAADVRFVGWTGAVADRTALSTSLLMDAPKSVTAHFRQSYEIRTLAELQAIATTGDFDGYYTLMNDIDASDTANWNDAGTSETDLFEGFCPIGTTPLSSSLVSFRGIFEGNGKKITGLTINRPGASYAGLFASLGAGGEIRNLILEGGSVTGDLHVGGLAGQNSQGKVESCSVSCSITGQINTGGLVGYCYAGSISNSTATGAVSGGPYRNVRDGNSCTGGLVGYNSCGSIENSVAAGRVVSGGPVGGLVGQNEYGSITTCCATGAVVAADGDNSWIAGGLVGYCYSGSITQSFATGPVTGTTRINPYSSSGSDCFGGLVGSNFAGTIANCFATGAVTETFTPYPYVGGLIGSNWIGTITHCFATGTVITSDKNYGETGGLIGIGGGILSANYWDVETTGQSVSAGDTGVVGKTSVEMKRGATFQPGGGTGADDWDFTSVWGIVEGQSYPYLRFAPVPFHLNVVIEGKGSVVTNPSGGSYASGTTVTLTATAAAGYCFDRWLGGVTNPMTTATALFMDSHKSVTARFRLIHEIRTLAELQAVATGDLEGRYLLMNDLDASDTANWNDAGTDTSLREGFRPIGTCSTSPVFDDFETISFRGIFDGNGKKITGLTINRPAMDNVGLFGCVGMGGLVKNLTLEAGTISGCKYTGAAIGVLDKGGVENCHVHMTVQGRDDSIGGLIGYNNRGSIANCSVAGVVMGVASSNSSLGGLIGYNSSGSVCNSFASVAVTETGWSRSCLGGLVGSNDSSILSNCYAIGPVTSAWNSGGLVGSDSNSTITACYWDQETTGQTASAGGGVGKTTAQMKLRATFQPGGGTGGGDWDFASVWGIVEGQSYPYLRSLESTPPMFHLDVTALNLGSVTLNPSGDMYAAGTVVTLTATPGTEYHLERWIGAVADPQTLVTTVLMDADKSVLAHFAINEYVLAIECENGSVYNPNGYAYQEPYSQILYPYGTTLTLIAQPHTGYHFTEWTGPVANPAAVSTTVYMDGNKNVAAHFELDQYPLTIEALNGSVVKSPDQPTYPYGTTVTLTAIPDARYRFIGWSGSVADPTTISTTILMDSDKSVTAFFELNEYTVTVEATSGSVTKSPDQTTYTYGSVVALTATPDAGYRFVGWTGPVADWTTSSTTLVVTGDTTVTARFGRVYEIRTLAELQAIATGDLEGYYLLMNDIAASVTATWNDAGTSATVLEGFRPIGTYSNPDTTSFRGVFEGNGKKITGLTINRSYKDHVGLFGVIGQGGSVKDLTLADGTVKGRNWVGGLVGKNAGYIARVATCISVTGKMGPLGLSPEPKPTSQNVGGLAGDNVGGTLTDCSSTGPVTGEAASVPCYTGGLVGYNSGTLGQSYASGRVVGEGPSTSNGGVIFYLESSEEMANRSAVGTVVAVTGNTSVGGLVGNNDHGTLAECFATGAVVGGEPTTIYGNPSVGGLVGFNQAGAVTDSFATGAVTCTTIFEAASNFSSCVGGLIGSNNAAENKVSNCFATGRVTAEGWRNFAGGLVGTGSSVKACYWDRETTGQSASAGGAGAIGKATAQMKQKATFQPGGGTGATDWDFTSVWGIVEGQTYPYFRAVSSEPLQFRLDVSVVGAGAGSVTLDPPGGVYAPGTVVTLTATAEQGSRFADWTGPVAAPEAVSTTIVLDTHKTVSARFLRHYEIRTLTELQAMKTGDPEGYYSLMNDIDASVTATWNDADTTVNVLEGFWPIGASVYDNGDTAPPRFPPWDPTPLPPDPFSFEGVFDGNGKKIVGLTINRPGMRYVGLFRSIGMGGVVKDLTLEGGSVRGSDVGGVVVGRNMGSLIRCAASGSLAGSKTDAFAYPLLGGLAGENLGQVRSCLATGPVTANGTSIALGGLVARNSGTIENSFATGEVTKPGLIQKQILYPAGGLVAENTGTIRNCFATGAVTGGNVTGGLVGYNKESGHVVNAYATGLVTGSVYRGGLIGRSLSNPGTVTACYWDVETTSQTTSEGGSGKTSLQMKRKNTFPSSWDFTSVWGIVEGKSYPYLSFTPPLYHLKVSVEGAGSVALSPAGGTYLAGTIVTLTPKPEGGACFSGWLGDVPPGSKPWQVPLDIEMRQDASLTARFAPIRHSGVWMVR